MHMYGICGISMFFVGTSIVKSYVGSTSLLLACKTVANYIWRKMWSAPIIYGGRCGVGSKLMLLGINQRMNDDYN